MGIGSKERKFFNFKDMKLNLICLVSFIYGMTVVIIFNLASIPVFAEEASILPYVYDSLELAAPVDSGYVSVAESIADQPKAPTNNKWVNYYNKVFQPYYLGSVGITCEVMQYEYIGDYYITAYCPEECGYNGSNYPTGWITSTGTIAHREEEWWIPSTCGINTALLNYGDQFLIDGKMYVAEDTGYVTMPLIDLFMPSYEQMMTHGSHWTDVYKVSYVELEPVKGWHFDINKFVYSIDPECPYK